MMQSTVLILGVLHKFGLLRLCLDYAQNYISVCIKIFLHRHLNYILTQATDEGPTKMTLRKTENMPFNISFLKLTYSLYVVDSCNGKFSYANPMKRRIQYY